MFAALEDGLQAYALKYPAESERVHELLAFLKQQSEACFDRQTLPHHFTASAWMLDSTHTKVLLTYHKKLNRWVQLGGHADGEADLLKVAYCEAQEESGIDTITPFSEDIFDIDVVPFPAKGDMPAHEHYDIRYVLQAETEDFLVSDESHDLRWILLKELETFPVDDSVRRMGQKWKALSDTTHAHSRDDPAVG